MTWNKNYKDLAFNSPERCTLWEKGDRHPYICMFPLNDRWKCRVKCAPTHNNLENFKCDSCSGQFPELENQIEEEFLNTPVYQFNKIIDETL